MMMVGVPLMQDASGGVGDTAVRAGDRVRLGGEEREPAEVAVGLAFARLTSLVRSNDLLLAELKSLDSQGVEARAYLAAPSTNAALGRAYLERIRARRSRVLAILRANRMAAREFLAT